MGSATVALRECLKTPAQLRLALSGSSGCEPIGPRLLLALCYSTKKRALVVTVCRGTDLPPQDSNGYSDPFVKLYDINIKYMFYLVITFFFFVSRSFGQAKILDRAALL